MSAKKSFSKKELADQNAKVAEIAKEESRLLASIERGEKKLAEDRDKLKETQKARAAENAVLEGMIQKGIKAAAKGETTRRSALIAALLMGSEDGDDGDDGEEGKGGEPSGTEQTPAPAPAGRKSATRETTDPKQPSSGEAGEQSQSEAA